MKIKKLFQTPKKAVITSASAFAIILALGTATVFATSTIAESNSIGKPAAETTALTDAGVLLKEARFITTEFEFEDGQFIYEVEFTADGIEYDYVIKASNGKVLSRRVQIDEDYIKAETIAPVNATPAPNYITIEAAKQIALGDAGVKASEATFTKQYLDIEDGFAVYDVEFTIGTYEYDYEINAITGEVFDKGREAVKIVTAPTTKSETTPKTQKPETFNKLETSKQPDATTKPETTKKPSTTAKPNTKPMEEQNYIGLGAAKKKALADAGVKAKEVTYTKGKLDNDAGVAVYDIEFYTATKEYEYEINAITGAITERSIESIDHNDRYDHDDDKYEVDKKPSQNASYITVDKAKSIALRHAGLAASEVSFSKAKLERDDGLYVYEIEFFKGNTEYEYTINAVSGKIRDYDSEIDD